nr:translocation/assembly module TamB domain-containing protein [Pedobacter sp. SYSU D00535]
MSGNISARLKVTGNIFDPSINGTASLRNAGFTINYLKTPYRITDNVTVQNSVIHLDELELRDINGNRAVAYGTVDMKTPNRPFIDVTIRATRFMALNTTAKDNPLYYGTAYGTGTFKFTGPTNNMRINIDAKTEEGTVFNVPLNAAETVGSNDFITFISGRDSSNVSVRQPSFAGLIMTFDLRIDEASQVNIITDFGRLQGRGDATLRLNITSAGDFEMYGDYLISSGKYEFTAQDYINKIFEIRRGGSIRWTGDPTEATINLVAAYELRANLGPLYQAANRPAISQTVQTEAIINLSGDLTRPDIRFDVNFPADAYIKDELQNYFSDVSNKEIQALSLIVRRSFAPNTGLLNDDAVRETALSAGAELVFNKLNTIVAELFNIRSLDLNIRSLNEASASVRLLNERLIITGGVIDNRDAQISEFDLIGGNRVTTDVEALYFLKKDRSLILRASNKLNNRSFLTAQNLNQENYVSALGLVYRQDFDNFGEFLRALIGEKRREERSPNNAPNPAIPPPTPAASTPSASAPARRAGDR